MPDVLPIRAPAVIHVGLMSRDRGLGLLYETSLALRARCPEAEIRILGPVEWHGLPDESRRTPEAWVAAGVRFLGTVPVPEVFDHLLRASVGWLPRDHAAPNARLAWPNKLGEYMMAALPVVASDLPVQARIVCESGCGVLVEQFSAMAHAAALADLLNDPVRARSMGEAGRRAAGAGMSFESQAGVLRTLYAELLELG